MSHLSPLMGDRRGSCWMGRAIPRGHTQVSGWARI